MKVTGYTLFLTALTSRLVQGLTASEWAKQSIYQVMTDRFARTDGSTTATCDPSAQVYCGGTYKGLISKLDYIQGMGFTAIWISPIVKQMDGLTKDGSSYHGYWATDIYSINPAFGTKSDLQQLSAELHARGMYLMLDIVTNHMAYKGSAASVDYSTFNPFSSPSQFHPPCSINYNNQSSIEQCWQTTDTVSLADLRTEDASIRSTWNAWIRDIIATYSIDGLRIDSAKHQERSFYPQFSLAANNIFLLGEVLSGEPSYLAAYQDVMDGVLDYASYYWITNAFSSTSGSVSALANGLNTLRSVARNLSLYGSFLENHDQPRFASLTSDLALAKNAIAFTMLKDGIPVVYQGQEQHYAGGGTPKNREAIWSSGFTTSSPLYAMIGAINRLRSWAIRMDGGYLGYQAYAVYTDYNVIAMRKGSAGSQVVGVYSNLGSSGSKSLVLSSSMTGFVAGQSVVDVLSCSAYTVDNGGNLGLTISNGQPKVFYPLAQLVGSGICPDLTGGGGITTTKSGYPTTTIATTLSTTTKSASYPTETNFCTATTVPVTFSVKVATTYGETIKIAGNVTALGNWGTASALPLTAAGYSASNPVWSGTVNLPSAVGVAFKFIRVSSGGSVTWESGANRMLGTGCSAGSFTASWNA